MIFNSTIFFLFFFITYALFLSVKNKKAVKEFKKVYKNVKEEKGRYYVVKERKNRVLKDKLKEILEKEDVVSRVKDLVIF